MKMKTLIMGSILAVGLLSSCDSDDDNNNESSDAPLSIAAIVESNNDFSTLNAALEAAELDAVLDAEGSYTVFAPTNAAFDALPEGTVEALLENVPKLTKILQQHVIARELSSTEVLAESKLTSLFGQDLAIDAEGVTIGGVKISSTDISASNGVVHVIDAVLIPRNIVEEAEYRGFTTLKAAIDNAGADVVDALTGDDIYTVFAPTNDAFADIQSDVDSLLANTDKTDLTAVLQNHLVSGESLAADVVALDSVENANGDDMSVSVSGDEVSVNGDSKITATDIKALNGVIHVIDKVITTIN